MTPKTLLERAFELTRAGNRLAAVKTKLRGEGFTLGDIHTQLGGRAIRTQLSELARVAREG